MPSNQEKLDYVAGPAFKRDIFAGGSPDEVDARGAFIGQLLNHGVQVGDSKDVTSVAQFLRWYGAGLDNVYRAEIANGAKLDALTAAFTGAIKAMAGGASFDEEKFLASVQERVATGIQAGLDAVTANVTLSVKSADEAAGHE